MTVAEELALAVAQMRNDTATQDEAGTYARAAVATIQEALDAGLTPPSAGDWPEAFAVLESEPAFARLQIHR